MAAKERRPSKTEFPYWLGETVFLRVLSERVPGIVTGVLMRPGAATYLVSWPDGEVAHYDFELSTEWVPEFTEGSSEDD
jgi:hypothetical protein